VIFVWILLIDFITYLKFKCYEPFLSVFFIEHIAQHGHLHDTPSGEQIESSGLELGSMMANQQAKSKKFSCT